MSQSQEPIDLYYWPTPNGWKISIMLEECGLPYASRRSTSARASSSSRTSSRSRRTTACPRSSIPTGRTARRSRCSSRARSCNISRDKTGRFGGETAREQVAVGEWLFWQMGGLGPMCGQANHFRNLRAGEGPLCDRPLHQRGQPAVRRDEQAARRPRISRRPLFDRRHRLRRLDEGLEALRPGHRRLPASAALARRGAGAPRGAARHRARRPRRASRTTSPRTRRRARSCSASARAEASSERSQSIAAVIAAERPPASRSAGRRPGDPGARRAPGLVEPQLICARLACKRRTVGHMSGRFRDRAEMWPRG